MKIQSLQSLGCDQSLACFFFKCLSWGQVYTHMAQSAAAPPLLPVDFLDVQLDTRGTSLESLRNEPHFPQVGEPGNDSFDGDD